jgi:hypothetical protein
MSARAVAHFLVRSANDLARSSRFTRDRDSVESPLTGAPHRQAAERWLMRSIEACGGRASSKGYAFPRGWMPPYPETSGYLIPTLLSMAREDDDESAHYLATAEAIADWLVSIQLECGGFSGRELGAQTGPDVFDTGMILIGFSALSAETGSTATAEAAGRAANFLVSCMDDRGCFVRHLSNGLLHAYNVRSAWALAAHGRLAAENRFVEAGIANARWTRDQQNDAGFFVSNAFKRGGNANTHGIAYVLQGLLQIDDIVGDQGSLESVVRSAKALQRLYAKHGWIAAELAPDWQYLSRHVCLTGYAQLAIIFLRLFQKTGDDSYRMTAERLLEDVARTQDLRDPSAPYYGAIAGSFPIYGRYAPLQYPNWAAKFFVDALIAKGQVDSGKSAPDRLQVYRG